MNTLLKSTLLVCTVFASVYVHAQSNKDQDIRLESEWVEEGDKYKLEIKATLLSPGSYSVLIQFTEGDNIDQPREVFRVVDAPGTVLTVRPVDTQRPLRCGYRYYHTIGYMPKKVDSAFVYRLPYSIYRSKPVKAYYLYNAGRRYFHWKDDKNWSALRLLLAKGDTVFAMRKGEVVKIKDGFDPIDVDGRVGYTSDTNSITIQHTDGTVCYYSLFEKGSFMVSEGDVVYPGTPLGLCGEQNKREEDYQLRLSVYYPEPNKDIGTGEKETSFYHTCYNPVFATDRGNVKLEHSGEYRAVSSQELVQKEMTKKELRKHK